MKMQIHETKIEESALIACIARMKSAPFKASDIAKVAVENGVPESVGREYIACRVADRLIQRQRKAGNIKVGSPYPKWAWVS
jgi:hypothetical protein